MIEVLFNSRKMDWDLKDILELPASLKKIELDYLPEGNFIRDVLLDGKSIVVDGDLNLEGIPAEQKEQARSINVISCTIIQLAQEAVTGALNYLAQLVNPVSQVAKQFSTGQIEKAQKNLYILMDGLSTLISLLASLETNFQLEYNRIRINGVSIRGHLQNFRSLVQNLVRAQEQKDNITIADLLEYELTPQLNIWSNILGALRETVEEKTE